LARIPQNIIEDIKYRNPIEDVISSYVTLSKSGSNMKGLCPFHSEKTPSFTVYTASSSFYCFGCGAGGDVVSFIMKAENLDYPSAVEFLAKRVGITIPDNGDDPYYKKSISRSKVIEMNTAAARFFRELLFDEKIGAPGRTYLAARHLEVPIIKRFGIGFAPDSFNMLRDHLRKLGYKDDEMVEASLCGRSTKTGAVYDFFRNRVMFPLIDVSGNVVAFGGRTLEKEHKGRKYINTGDTPAFNKRKTLFALNFAKNYCSDYLILVEGNVDVVTLHQAGFENAIAPLGTAFSSDHARMIKKYTDRVIVSYDSDSAGQTNTEKVLKALDEVGVESKVIKLEGAKDPDEYINKFGKEAFKALIDDSRTKFDFLIDKSLSKYNIQNDDDKVAASKELASIASELSSRVERDLFITKVSSRLGVNKQSFEYDVSSMMRKKNFREKKEQREELVRKTSGISDRVNRDFARNPKAARLEETVLGMMLSCTEFIQKVSKEKLLSEDDFFTEYGRRLFGIMMGADSDGGFDFSVLNEKMTPDEVSRAQKLITERLKLSNTDAVFKENVDLLKKEIDRQRSKNSGSNDDLSEKIRRLREKTEK